MGLQYDDAIDIFVDRERTFINALQSISPNDLSIVIHGTGSNLNGDGSIVSAQQIGQYNRIRTDRESTHFTVGRDGTVVQSVLLSDGAAGNCCLETGHDQYWDKYYAKYTNLNLCTISIEHCNDSTNSLYPTSQQLIASIRLVKWLVQKFKIPYGHIKTHASLAPIDRKNCPGNYPMDVLIKEVYSHMSLPNGAHDNGTTITFDNNPYHITEFRDVYLKLSEAGLLPYNDSPLNNAYTSDPVEVSNPTFWGGAGMAQETRYFRFGSSPTKGAIVTWLGQEYDALKSQNETFKTSLASADAQIQTLASQLTEAQAGSNVDLSTLKQDFIAAETTIDAELQKVEADVPGLVQVLGPTAI